MEVLDVASKMNFQLHIVWPNAYKRLSPHLGTYR